MTRRTSPRAVLANLRREHPERYRRLYRSYTEAFLAIEQDGVDDWDDATFGDVEEQLWLLRKELEPLYGQL